MEDNNVKICPLTGDEAQITCKKMCINCAHLSEENNGLFCSNEENKADAVERVKKAMVGYEIENISLKPLPLKDETKRCNRWMLHEEKILKYIREQFDKA